MKHLLLNDEKMNGQNYLEKEIQAPYMHLQRVAGKQFRNKIILAFNYWLKVPEDLVKRALDAITMMHNASLLIDDIQDNSILRRGMPAAHCIYGIPLTLNNALQMLMKAVEKTLHLVPDGSAGYVFTKHCLDMLHGQGVDIYWRDNFVCPTEDEYKTMTQQKTGGMLLYGVKLLQLLSQNKNNYDDFVKHLGLYIQLRDDYCNFANQGALEEWPGNQDIHANIDDIYCEDITEGKFSLPVIHAMKTLEGPRILNILRQRTRDVQLKKYCVHLLEKSGSLQYTRDMLSEMDREAREKLTRLGGNPLMEAVLDGLLSWKDSGVS